MQINLREAEKNDCEQLFNWVNDNLVRESSFSNKKISWEEHKKWYFNHLKKNDSWIYIASSGNGNLIGQVRFDLIKENSVEIDISLDSRFRGGGLGAELIKVSVKQLFIKEGIKNFLAKVKSSNIASSKSFLNAGFLKQTESLNAGNGFECYIFNYISEDE